MTQKSKQTIDLIKSIQTKLTKSASLMLLTLMLMSGLALAQPTITAFAPASGVIGSSVTITGTGFNTTAAQNIVFFGATKAVVTAASSSSLTVTVPLGATYQYISVTNLAVNLTTYSAKPFIVTLAGSINFEPKIDFAVGSNPTSVCLGDLDCDGKTDLIVANRVSNTVSVLRNTSSSGTISFAAKVDFATDLQPYSVSIGDIDGDGKLDLAVACSGGHTLSVLRNTSIFGTVSFSAKLNFAIISGAVTVSLGDIDSDGKPDLVVPNYGPSTLSIFRNTSILGQISFATNVDFAIGVYAQSVCIGDINGDNKPDLAVANSGSNNVSVLKNTSTSGTISFAAKIDFATGSFPTSVSLGDLDNNGKPDLITANRFGNSVSIFRNTSQSGNIRFAAKLDLATIGGSARVSIGDIDGDGKPDLAVANVDNSTALVLRNTSTIGALSFGANVYFPTGSNPNSLAIGDLDCDGKPDLAVANYSSNTVSVIRQVSCNAPNGLTTKSITASSANTKWDTVDCAVGYKFQYKIPWQTQWTTLHHNLDYPSKKLRSLLPSTKYLWRVKAKYANGTYSNNSAIATFTTLALRSGNEINDSGDDLFVYPNPAADLLNLEFPFTEGVSTKITVVNTIGQTVLEQNVSDDLSTIQLNIQSLTNGLYVVTVINGDNTFTERFIKE